MRQQTDDFAAGYLLGQKKGKAKTMTKTITENGTYNAEDEPVEEGEKKYDGYSSVIAEVPTYEEEYEEALEEIEDLQEQLANMGTKTIIVNGTYTAADDNYTGYTAVTVNVPSGTLGTKTIVANGTYTAATDNYYGYSEVTVNVPSEQPEIEPLSVTVNGTYTASGLIDGYSPVTVNVPTYEEEYEEMLECQAEIAEILGLDPPYDCDDIKDAIEDQKGVNVPEDVPQEEVNEIALILGGTVTDTSTAQGCAFGIIDNNYPNNFKPSRIAARDDGYRTFQAAYKYSYKNARGEIVVGYGAFNSFGLNDSGAYGKILSATVATDGTITVKIVWHHYGNKYGVVDWWDDEYTYSQTQSGLSGYGASGHTYKVTN